MVRVGVDHEGDTVVDADADGFGRGVEALQGRGERPQATRTGRRRNGVSASLDE